jgi:Protein of unknown function (DUF433)
VKVLLEPGEDLLPSVHRRLIDGEERVAGALVGVELVGLAGLLKRGLRPSGVLGRGARVLPAEQNDVLDYLASGMSQEEILRDFPDLTPEDIRA